MNDAPSNVVETQARIVADLLKEYTEKIANLNEEMVAVFYPKRSNHDERSYLARLIDRAESIELPLRRIIQRASALVETVVIDPLLEDVLALRLSEIEVELHHFKHRKENLQKYIERSGELLMEVYALRMSAGLPLTKNGKRK